MVFVTLNHGQLRFNYFLKIRDHLIEICTAKQKEQIKAMIYCTCILAMRTMHFFLNV